VGGENPDDHMDVDWLIVDQTLLNEADRQIATDILAGQYGNQWEIVINDGLIVARQIHDG
jgi:hypothetical protein